MKERTTLEKICKFAAFFFSLTKVIPHHWELRQQKIESLLALEVASQDWKTAKNLREKPKEQESQTKNEYQNVGMNSVQILDQPQNYSGVGVCPESQAKNTARIWEIEDERYSVQRLSPAKLTAF